MAIWYGAYGFAGMSKEIVARFNAEMAVFCSCRGEEPDGGHRGRDGQIESRRTREILLPVPGPARRTRWLTGWRT